MCRVGAGSRGNECVVGTWGLWRRGRKIATPRLTGHVLAIFEPSRRSGLFRPPSTAETIEVSILDDKGRPYYEQKIAA